MIRYLQKDNAARNPALLFFISVEPSLQAVMRYTKRKFVEKREGKDSFCCRKKRSVLIKQDCFNLSVVELKGGGSSKL